MENMGVPRGTKLVLAGLKNCGTLGVFHVEHDVLINSSERTDLFCVRGAPGFETWEASAVPSGLLG